MTDVNKLAAKVTDDGSKITTMIDDIRKAGATLQHMIAVTAASCVVHAVVHGNTTPANNLLGALPGMARTNALRDWFQVFGPFVFNEKTGLMVLNKGTVAKYKAMREDDSEAFARYLTEKPFWEFKPEPEYKPFNLKNELAKLYKRASGYQSDVSRAGKEDDFTGLEDVAKLIG